MSEGDSVDQSVSHLNLEYYRKRLARETDPTIKQILIRLIAEEEERLSASDPTRTGASRQRS